jgi:ribosomal protein S2
LKNFKIIKKKIKRLKYNQVLEEDNLNGMPKKLYLILKGTVQITKSFAYLFTKNDIPVEHIQ